MSSQSTDNGEGEAPVRNAAPMGSRSWQRRELKQSDIEAIVESEILEESTIDLLKSMLTKDLPMGYLSKKRFHEFKYLLKNRILEVLAEHPPRGSIYQGEMRKVLLDDERQTMSALTGKQKSEIRRIEQIILARAQLAVEGRQQEYLNEQRQVRIAADQRDHETDDSGGLIR